MTVQPEDVEPEENRATAPDWRADPNFTPPQRLPWSVLGPDFTAACWQCWPGCCRRVTQWPMRSRRSDATAGRL